MAFELDIAEGFLNYKKDEKVNFSSFNILSYFLFLMYKVGSYCGFFKEWKEMKMKDDCKEEMLRQLDVKLLIQRISFLERINLYILCKNKVEL